LWPGVARVFGALVVVAIQDHRFVVPQVQRAGVDGGGVVDVENTNIASTSMLVSNESVKTMAYR